MRYRSRSELCSRGSGTKVPRSPAAVRGTWQKSPAFSRYPRQTETLMRPYWLERGIGVALACGTIVAIAGCDTNYYGSGDSRSTTTVVPAAPVESSSTTTTVTPTYDGAVTTERSYRRY